MKQGLRCQRILILSLLSLSVLAPVAFLSARLGSVSPSSSAVSLFAFVFAQICFWILLSLLCFFPSNFSCAIWRICCAFCLWRHPRQRRRWGSWQRRWWGSWRLGSKGSWVQLTAEAVGFMAASTAFDVLYVYCVELFPTNVRNSAVSMLRQALMLRATVTPQLVVLGRVSPKLFFVVFECLSLFSGALTVWPPETRDAPLYETMEQQESDRREEEAAVKSCWRVRGGAAGARASLSSII